MIKSATIAGNGVKKITLDGAVLFERNDNIFDPSTASYVQWYIRFATHDFRWSSSARNDMAYIPCEPSTTYRVSILMDTRFRVASFNRVPIVSEFPLTVPNWAYHPLDTNGSTQVNEVVSLEFTTGAGDSLLFIQYCDQSSKIDNDLALSNISVIKIR